MSRSTVKAILRLRYPVAVALLTVLAISGCQWHKPRYTKYTDSFFNTFDTVVTVVMYTRTEQEFDLYFEKINTRFQELHRLYDIYNSYEGINNIRTINDNAGIRPVEVDKEIIDLIVFARDWYRRTGGQTNIAMGSVLRLWHEYRRQGVDDPDNAQLPPLAALQEAANHTDIDKVIVDTENSTVFLADKDMNLDVGAVAKGYATELVVQELIAEGLESAMISSGGQIRTIGKPLDGVRERWGVGIHDPSQSILSENNLLDVIFVNDASVANSGDYQRYYTVNGKVYHHLIDPQTFMPAEHYRVVTVMAEDSGAADFLSTALFLLPYEESRSLAETLDGVEAIWVMPDGRVEATHGMKRIMRSHGATGSKAE